MIRFERLELTGREGRLSRARIEAYLRQRPYIKQGLDGDSCWFVSFNRRGLESSGWRPPHIYVEDGAVILEGWWHELELGRVRQVIEWLLDHDDWHLSLLQAIDFPQAERDLGWLSRPGMLDELFGPLIAEDPYPLQWPIEDGHLLRWSVATPSWSRRIVLHDGGGRFEYDADDAKLEGRLAEEALPPWRAALTTFDADDPAFPDRLDFSPIAFVSVETPEHEEEEVSSEYDPNAPPPTVVDLHALALGLDARCRGWRDGDPLPTGLAELRERKR